MSRERVGNVSDFAEESLNAIDVEGRAIVVIRHKGAFHAVPDRCTHAKKPLSDGSLEDGKVVCCYHGARFDLETGKPGLPAVKPLARYAVEVEGDEVFVYIP